MMVSLTSIFLSADAFSMSCAYLTRAEVVCKAGLITSIRLAVILSGSMLETFTLGGALVFLTVNEGVGCCETL